MFTPSILHKNGVKNVNFMESCLKTHGVSPLAKIDILQYSSSGYRRTRFTGLLYPPIRLRQFIKISKHNEQLLLKYTSTEYSANSVTLIDL
jgi:hypothetical protein